jgi:uncharacterized protein YjeT (DUF2065 family)
LIVSTRLPLLIAPALTISAFRSMLGTNPRVRALGVVMAAIGALMLWSSIDGKRTAAYVIFALGWLMELGALWLTVAPATYRSLADVFFDMGDEVMRVLGALGTAIGAYLIYFALAPA